MQILSSSFPTGAPGTGLLLLRIALAAALISEASGHSLPTLIAAAGIALSLSIGCLTMIAALLAALMHTIDAFTSGTAAPMLSCVLIAQSVALALLGPGAYSLDARLFGRRLIFESRQQQGSD
jgi:hypothetical protein